MDIQNHHRRHRVMAAICLIHDTFNASKSPSILSYSEHIKPGHAQQYQQRPFLEFTCLVLAMSFPFFSVCKYGFLIFHCGSMV